MESASIPVADGDQFQPKEGGKGLKTGALGYLSNLVIGVASTAPGYSLAATLGGGLAALTNPLMPDLRKTRGITGRRD